MKFAIRSATALIFAFCLSAFAFGQSQSIKRRCPGNSPSPAYATIAVNTDGSVSITACSGKTTTITGITAAGLNFANGSEGSPSMTFTSDPNTGIYRVSADELGITGGGNLLATFAATPVPLIVLGDVDLASNGTTLTIDDLNQAVVLGSSVQLTVPEVIVTGQVAYTGSSTGSTSLQAAATASGALTLPAATDTLVGKATTDVLTNKTLTNPARTVQALTDQATIAWDTSAGAIGTVTLGGNRTMGAPTNLKAGGQYILQLTQDATGSRTVTWNAAFKWTGATAPTLTTTAARKDVIRCDSIDGSTLLCQTQLDVR